MLALPSTFHAQRPGEHPQRQQNGGCDRHTYDPQPDREAAEKQLSEVVKALEPRWPKAADTVGKAVGDKLAYMNFPPEHRTRIYSTNTLERLNKEIKRRTNVVGIFPDRASVIRLVGSILMEISDEWQVGRRYFSKESMRKLSEPDQLLVAEAAPLRLALVH